MKKFVSIVIALVMVLSMTSAFAWSWNGWPSNPPAPSNPDFAWSLDCEVRDFAWDCGTEDSYCGKGKVDVQGYVKQNAACDKWEYVASECATSILEDEIYYTVAVTVDAYPNPAWWAKSKLEAKYTGVAANFTQAQLDTAIVNLWNQEVKAADYDDTEAHTFYLLSDSTWIEDEDVEDIKDVMYKGVVTKAPASICYTLKSEHSGVGTFTWNGYTVVVGADYSITITHEDFPKASSKVEIQVKGGKVYDVKSEDAAFYAMANSDFNLNACSIGTCINKDSIQANFGWKDSQKDCYDWDKVGQSDNNPECSVTVDIPKTGDVSVVAYAVMAIVAAAGTMLKK